MGLHTKGTEQTTMPEKLIDHNAKDAGPQQYASRELIRNTSREGLSASEAECLLRMKTHSQ